MGRRVGVAVAALAMGTICLTAALLPAMGAAEGGETPTVVKVGNEAPADFNFGISPTLLPAGDPGATELRLDVEENPGVFPGGIPPGIREARFGLDRSIHLEPHGPPVCRWPAIESGEQIQTAGPSECPRAVIGRVEATIEFALAENPPIQVPVTGKVYNGGTRPGATDLLLEMALPAPIFATLQLLVPVRVVGQGRIGSEATVTVPTLVGGYGFLIGLSLDLRRGFSVDGERGGYVTAACPDGKLMATFAADFTDGTQYAQPSVRACTPHRSS
jgi:hypothetical protein